MSQKRKESVVGPLRNLLVVIAEHQPTSVYSGMKIKSLKAGKIKHCLTFSFPLQEFIREGCLYKLTKKGLQQRMFFLVGVAPDFYKPKVFKIKLLGKYVFTCLCLKSAPETENSL